MFAYDIARDGPRARVAALLETKLVRVQGSMFEGRLTRREADRLAEAAALRIAPTDSLRVYCLTEEARAASRVFGGPPLPEPSGFMLL